jgi:hypothetical protein
MKNLKEYGSHLTDFSLDENSEYSQCMSEDAKQAVKTLCEEMLCKEAMDYHNDAHENHTYEGYISECMGYLKEAMGQAGYAPLVKPHAE